MTESNLPIELIQNFSTIEYTLPRVAPMPPVFLFVIDTCVEEDELQVCSVLSRFLTACFALMNRG